MQNYCGRARNWLEESKQNKEAGIKTQILEQKVRRDEYYSPTAACISAGDRSMRKISGRTDIDYR